MMTLLAIGVSHRTAPIEIRERLWFSKEETRAALPQLKEKYFGECVLISTCNRTELYGIPKRDSIDFDQVRGFLTQLKQAGSSLRPEHFYQYSGREAAHQLLKVSSGIDSMVLGDVQVLGQVKEAYRLAEEAQTIGFLTSRLFQTAFHAGKRSRSETEISQGAVSISYGAVELASKIYDNLGNKRALLIGAGKTGELTIKHLQSKGIGSILIANRTKSKATELADRFGGQVVEFDDLKSQLRSADIVISSVEGPGFVLTAGDLSRAMKERANRPLLILDLGVPRNIDPAANKIENTFLHDIDALQIIIDRNLEKRKGEIKKVERINEEELERFLRWQNSLQVNPTIEQLETRAEGIRQEEVQKHHHRFRPEEREILEILTKRIVNKILHLPIINLKNGQGRRDDETVRMIATVQKLFGLSSEDPRRPSKTDDNDSQKME